MRIIWSEHPPRVSETGDQSTSIFINETPCAESSLHASLCRQTGDENGGGRRLWSSKSIMTSLSSTCWLAEKQLINNLWFSDNECSFAFDSRSVRIMSLSHLSDPDSKCWIPKPKKYTFAAGLWQQISISRNLKVNTANSHGRLRLRALVKSREQASSTRWRRGGWKFKFHIWMWSSRHGNSMDAPYHSAPTGSVKCMRMFWTDLRNKQVSWCF